VPLPPELEPPEPTLPPEALPPEPLPPEPTLPPEPEPPLAVAPPEADEPPLAELPPELEPPLAELPPEPLLAGALEQAPANSMALIKNQTPRVRRIEDGTFMFTSRYLRHPPPAL
jgi:hypothetical protein